MGTTTTQTVGIPDAGATETSIMKFISGELSAEYLAEQGWEANPTTQVWEDSKDKKGFDDRRKIAENKRNADIKKMEEWGAKYGLDPNNPAHLDYALRTSHIPLPKEVEYEQNYQKTIGTIDREEEDFKVTWEGETVYDFRKMGSPEAEAARDKLLAAGYTPDDIEQSIAGPTNDPAVQAYIDQLDADKEAEVAETGTVDSITQDFLDATEKFVSGDFSITDEQKAQIADTLAPIKAAMDEMFKGVRAEIDKTEAATDAEIDKTEAQQLAEINKTEKKLEELTKKTFDEFEKRIEGTHMSVFQGLQAVGAQIKQTGADMEGALKSVIGVHEELLQMGIEDFTGEVTQKVSENAARIGRTPDDPEYSAEIQGMVAREVKSGRLNLAAMEAQGLLTIKERTGAGLEGVERDKVGATQRRGESMEQASLLRGGQQADTASRFGGARIGLAGDTGLRREALAGSTGMRREGVASAEGQANIGLAQQGADLEYKYGVEMPSTMIQTGMGVSQYADAISKTDYMNVYGPMKDIYGTSSEERRAQPTTTQTTSTDWLSMIFGAGSGVISGATSAYVGK